MVSMLSEIGFGVAAAGHTLDCILEFAGNNSLPPISNNIGDWAYISYWFGAVPALAGKMLIGKGERENKRYLVKVGEYLPKIITTLATIYFTLGESVFPKILPGTADPNDIPAVLLAGIATYLGVDVITNYGKNKRPKIHSAV